MSITLSSADIGGVMELVASPDPYAAYQAVDALAQRVIGPKLFTAMRQTPATMEVERLYSSDTAHYPPGGRKQKQGAPWAATVLDRGEVFIAATADEVEANFADHALLAGMGITAIMNIPIRFGGRVLGTMNLCHRAGHFTQAMIVPAQVMAGLLVPLLLADGEA